MSKAHGRPSSRRLRVCLVVPYDMSPEAGGVKQHAVHLMAGLRRLGDSVTLIGPASKPVTQPHTVGFGGIVNIHGNGSENRMALLCSPRSVARFFAQNTFDVVHMHEPEVPMLTYWAAWMQRHVAKVATFHAYAERPPRHVQWIRRTVGKVLYRSFQQGVAVSEGAKILAQDAFAGRPLTIIPNGVDHRLFCPHDAPQVHSNVQHRALGEPFRLLFVGGVNHPRKGARYLFEAVASLVGQGHDVVVDVVGARGREAGASALPAYVRQHHDVSTQKLAALYRSCDALVAPATGQESFGIILLEAMASGKPIIASDIEGYRRVLSAGRELGSILVPPKDAQALTRGIAHMMALPEQARRVMGAHNRKSVAPFTWDTVTQQLRQIYLTSIDGARGSS